jgi:hypothetical protein
MLLSFMNMSKLREYNQRMAFMKIEFDIIERKQQNPELSISTVNLHKVKSFISEYEKMNKKVGELKQISDDARAKFWSYNFEFIEDMREFVFRRAVDSLG